MKVSIITVVYNGYDTIESSIRSVLFQNYNNMEYIIIDGGSTDGTLDILKKYKNEVDVIVSEKDKGIYDAMNKGIKLSTGDIIGILNSDDFYMNEEVISTVVHSLKASSLSGIYSDLLYVDRYEGTKIIRYWKAGYYSREKFYWGWMPPHPTVFLKKEVYEKYGGFNIKLKSAADYEFLLRIMLKNNVRLKYINKVLIKMRVGGKSNISLYNRLRANMEDLKAWRINGLSPYPFTTLVKPLTKLKQYWSRPTNK